MSRKVSESVVVITGASSGIGRAAALEFARSGAFLVLAARREAALQELAQQCQQLGARALAVPTDVTDEEAVQRLARQAIENFGRLDVWVNNAAVSLFARFEESPADDFRRVIETNLFGYIHGARAALPYFREQGSGILINVSSVVAETAQPYTSAYASSKSAIRGLSDCLRMELSLDEAPDIHVCTVLPASIDTPLFQQAANYTGRRTKALDPVYSAEKVGKSIVHLARHPKRQVVVGNAGRVLMAIQRLLPGLSEHFIARQVDQNHFQPAPAAPTAGNLWNPLPQYGQVSGGWRDERPGGGLARWALLGLAVAAPALIYWARQRYGLPHLDLSELGGKLQQASRRGTPSWSRLGSGNGHPSALRQSQSKAQSSGLHLPEILRF